MSLFSVHWLHENALLATAINDEHAGAQVVELFQCLERQPLPGRPALVPGARTLLLQWTTPVADPDAVSSIVLAWTGESAKKLASSRLHEIPVAYGQGEPNDLNAIAHATRMSPNEVIHLHSQATYTVAFLGFQPGFPYLTGLPEALKLPRLASPRLRVAAGSVAMADIYSGIYPKASPGGWHILGVSAVTLFDPTHPSPSLLQTGNRVRFIPQ